MKSKDINFLNIVKNRYTIYEDGLILDKRRNKIMPERISTRGYRTVSLNIEGYRYGRVAYYPFLVHRLVAQAFLKSDLKTHDIVNHEDLNKLNNHYSNFTIGTQKDNVYHAMLNNRQKAMKLTYDDVRDICVMLIDGRINDVMNKYNISYSSVTDIMYGKSWLSLTAKEFPYVLKVASTEAKHLTKVFRALVNNGWFPDDISDWFNISEDTVIRIIEIDNNGR